MARLNFTLYKYFPSCLVAAIDKDGAEFTATCFHLGDALSVRMDGLGEDASFSDPLLCNTVRYDLSCVRTLEAVGETFRVSSPASTEAFGAACSA